MTNKELIKMLSALKNDDGLTLKGYAQTTYKSGYQVATSGIETSDILEAVKAIVNYSGDCGVWLSGGVYYIDKSLRVASKAAALALGKACDQISILKWSDMSLIYC